jgi:hypothetical protein
MFKGRESKMICIRIHPYLDMYEALVDGECRYALHGVEGPHLQAPVPRHRHCQPPTCTQRCSVPSANTMRLARAGLSKTHLVTQTLTSLND